MNTICLINRKFFESLLVFLRTRFIEVLFELSEVGIKIITIDSMKTIGIVITIDRQDIQDYSYSAENNQFIVNVADLLKIVKASKAENIHLLADFKANHLFITTERSKFTLSFLETEPDEFSTVVYLCESRIKKTEFLFQLSKQEFLAECNKAYIYSDYLTLNLDIEEEILLFKSVGTLGSVKSSIYLENLTAETNAFEQQCYTIPYLTCLSKLESDILNISLANKQMMYLSALLQDASEVEVIIAPRVDSD